MDPDAPDSQNLLTAARGDSEQTRTRLDAVLEALLGESCLGLFALHSLSGWGRFRRVRWTLTWDRGSQFQCSGF